MNVCYLCATNIIDQAACKNALNLFAESAISRKILRHIQTIAGILLKCSINMPQLICTTCQSDLSQAIEFRRRCRKNCRKWEQGQQKSISTQRRTRSVRQCYRDKKEVNTSEAELSSRETSLEDEAKDKFKLECGSTEALATATDTSAPVREKKNSLVAPKSSRTKAILAKYFCDQCCVDITGKSSFERHLRKHANIRPYQCELCPARFLSAGELKGHQVMHTGAKNFQCRYCDRCYVNYSGRLRHERTHTNERPFVCAQCSKGFTNAYILKNHMLVHTGERMHRCDLCERSFSRSTHLETHYRSNTHKQKVAQANSSEKRSWPGSQKAVQGNSGTHTTPNKPLHLTMSTN